MINELDAGDIVTQAGPGYIVVTNDAKYWSFIYTLDSEGITLVKRCPHSDVEIWLERLIEGYND